MIRATAGSVLINSALPEELRDWNRQLDGKSVKELLEKVARDHPERYVDVAKRLSDIGREAAYSTGGFTFGLSALRPAKSYLQAKQEIRAEIDRIAGSGLSDDEKRVRTADLLNSRQKPIEDAIYKESIEDKNPLAVQVLSGSRGKPPNLKSLRGADLLYTDHRDRPIPIPVLSSFSQGLTPAEYFASTFGSRKGLVDVKLMTAKAGYFGKQLSQAAHRLMVTATDADGDGIPDPNPRGMPVDVNDPDNEGALLSVPVAGYGRNTPLTPKVMRDMAAKGVKRIVVRSPLVGGPPQGGLYARDVGIRERGGLAPIGDMVGLAGAQSVCLAGDTSVRMADGSCKKITEIRRGDMVLGCDRQGIAKPVRVLALYENGIQDCYETTFRVGTGRSKSLSKMTSTLEHKILSVVVRDHAKIRRPLPEIRPVRKPAGKHDRMYAKMPIGYDDGGHRNEPYALLLGLLIGDGCYTGGVGGMGIGFSCYDPVLVEELSVHLLKYGLRMSKMGDGGEYKIVSAWARGYKIAAGRRVRNPVKALLLEYGMWGQGSGQKHLPPNVWTWDNESIRELASGMFATDGYVCPQNKKGVAVGYSSSSLRLVKEFRHLLAVRLGVYTTSPSANRKKKPDGSRYEPVYSIEVKGRESVFNLYRSVKIAGVKKDTFDRLLTFWPESKKAKEPGRCALVSQVRVGEIPTFDIEVDHPDHLFVLENGLVVSNSEPVSQASLGSKHSGGVAGASKAVGGFGALDQFIQVPQESPNWAAHAEKDGHVKAIVDAPAGGKYVVIDGVNHYVPVGFDTLVKPGDEVEAGDILSDGLPNPAKVVQHKGVGEGRRYFVQEFRRSMQNSGIPVHRRNLELLARGLINHVRLEDEVGDHVPDDVVPYDTLEASWEPRKNARRMKPGSAVGKYLERPVLHYTVGTRVGKRVAADLDEFGVKEVDVHDDPPPFMPEMVRGMENLQHDPDPMSKMLGSNLQKSFLGSVHRGLTSDPEGTSYVPALANPVDFGRKGLVKGWDPKAPKQELGVLAGL